MTALGSLPPINGRPGVQVFKCTSCRRIASREQVRLPKDTLHQLDRIDRGRAHPTEPNGERDAPPLVPRTGR